MMLLGVIVSSGAFVFAESMHCPPCLHCSATGSHLPFGTSVIFAEVDMRDIVSPGTFQRFKAELTKREKARSHRIRVERKQDRVVCAPSTLDLHVKLLYLIFFGIVHCLQNAKQNAKQAASTGSQQSSSSAFYTDGDDLRSLLSSPPVCVEGSMKWRDSFNSHGHSRMFMFNYFYFCFILFYFYLICLFF